MSDLTWRPARPADTAALPALFAAAEHAAPVGRPTEPAEVQRWLASPGPGGDRHAMVGVDGTGRLLAYAQATDMGVADGVLRISLAAVVDPDPALGDEAGRRTHEWLIEHAGQIRRQRHPDLPCVLGTRCAEHDPTRLALLTDAGFETVFWQRVLVRSVVEPVTTVPVPDGITIVAYDKRYDEAARIAHNDAYADSPSALLPEPHAWPHHTHAHPSYLADASFLALTDPAAEDTGEQTIAGFLFSIQQNDAADDHHAQLHCVGTRAPWRRRGVAGAMISRALAAYHHTGFQHATLEVRSTNDDAVRLYEHLGFTSTGRSYAIMMRHLP
jgi:mycothiol synthase